MIYLQSKNNGGYRAHQRLSIDAPAPTIMAEGMGGDSIAHWGLCYDGREDRSAVNVVTKPAFSIPSLAQIRAQPRNGLRVVSTFSGAGGSCTGYEMAGFEVIWANEFMPIALESYQANHPHTIVDGRDVHHVQAEEILTVTGLAPGELDLFDGSPPCQAFSTAGRREKKWNKGSAYDNGVRQCNEALFPEYIRLLRGLKPKVFVAENVSGLTKGVAKGFFKETLRDLKASGYRVAARLRDAQWLGVPQARQRIIFLGVREDLGREPVYPAPMPYSYSIRDALPHLKHVRLRDAFADKHQSDMVNRVSKTIMTSPQGTGFRAASEVIREEPDPYAVIHDTGNFVRNVPIAERPCPAILASPIDSTHYLVRGPGDDETRTQRQPDGIDRRRLRISEVQRLCSFPDDYVLKGSYAEQWKCLGNSVPPVMMFHIARTLRDEILRKV